MESTKHFPTKAPGPKGRPIIGSLNERRKRPLSFFLETTRTYGDIVRYKMGYMTVHLLNDPDAIKYVLVDHAANFIKGFGYEQLLPVLGRGLLTSEGSFWRRQRKLAQPAFHRQRLTEISEVMAQEARSHIEKWRTASESGKPFDIAEDMMHLTLRIVGLTLLGSDVSADVDSVGTAVSCLLREGNRRLLSLTHFTEKLPLPKNLVYKRHLDTLNSIIYSIIEKRRANPGSSTPSGDLLSMFMAAQDEETGERMSNQQLRDEVMTMFLAGHETTANLLAWTFYLLSRHPGIERKVREELQTVLNGRTPRFDDLPQLVYLESVLEESLRLYPPAWILARQSTRVERVGGFDIPKGSVIVISPYVIHRNTKFWDNPEGFDPDRFIEKNSQDRKKYSYIPFGAGPRQCIGNAFALMEAKIILATALQSYQLDLLPGHVVEPEPLITLRPKNGVQMILKPVARA